MWMSDTCADWFLGYKQVDFGQVFGVFFICYLVLTSCLTIEVTVPVKPYLYSTFKTNECTSKCFTRGSTEIMIIKIKIVMLK